MENAYYVGTSPIGLILALCPVDKLHKYFINSHANKWDLSINIGSEELPAGAAAWSHDSKWIVTAGWRRRANGMHRTVSLNGSFTMTTLEGNPLDNLFSDLAAAPMANELNLARLLARSTLPAKSSSRGRIVVSAAARSRSMIQNLVSR
jgi:hypothetical protein